MAGSQRRSFELHHARLARAARRVAAQDQRSCGAMGSRRQTTTSLTRRLPRAGLRSSMRACCPSEPVIATRRSTPQGRWSRVSHRLHGHSVAMSTTIRAGDLEEVDLKSRSLSSPIAHAVMPSKFSTWRTSRMCDTFVGTEVVRTGVSVALHRRHPGCHRDHERRVTVDLDSLVAGAEQHRIVDVLDPHARRVARPGELDHHPLEALVGAGADVAADHARHSVRVAVVERLGAVRCLALVGGLGGRRSVAGGAVDGGSGRWLRARSSRAVVASGRVTAAGCVVATSSPPCLASPSVAVSSRRW